MGAKGEGSLPAKIAYFKTLLRKIVSLLLLFFSKKKVLAPHPLEKSLWTAM
jgi:hypothetical protein